MLQISDKEITRRIELENPWWDEGASIDAFYQKMTPRAYLERFYALLTETSVHRALVLMGPRRVGKTVIIHHSIQRLINSGVPARNICYISIDSPLYMNIPLERLVGMYIDSAKIDIRGCYVIFDEIQYLKGWEAHLKKLVDDYKETKFVVSGSAAAALRLKSHESGAGRFTSFLLPPLLFYEYLELIGEKGLIADEGPNIIPETTDISALNNKFVSYINIGGFPEALFSEAIQANPERYIRSDIIDKVLLRDLPSLYGIHDIQELNRLFMVIAYNTGDEVSLDKLSHGSGVAKNTIKRYLEYLEAAFLITILHRTDQSGRRFQRANFFKVYLTNTSMRTALFGPVTKDDELMGRMTETAILSQMAHSNAINDYFYARWNKGEVDLVRTSGPKIISCTEIKWSNRYFERPTELKELISFAKKHSLLPIVTTLDKRGIKEIDNIKIAFLEASVRCYLWGKGITSDLDRHQRII